MTNLMSLDEMREDLFADIPVVADDSDGSGHCWMSDYECVKICKTMFSLASLYRITTQSEASI